MGCANGSDCFRGIHRFFDRSFSSEQVAQAPATVAYDVNAQAQMAPAAVAPAPINAAEEAGVVTRLSILTGSLLQALQTEPAPAPRAAVVAVVVELIVEPVALARRVASLQDNEVSLAFFANAKATLMAQESCIGDLRSLTEQARGYFPSGGLKLDESGIAQARLIAALAQDCNGVEIIVEGHSDPSGDPAS